MKLVWDDRSWLQNQDQQLLKRIDTLIQDIARNGNVEADQR